MDEMLMRTLGTVYLALSAGLTDEQRRHANEMLLDMAERASTPYPCAEVLRVIAVSAAEREGHDNPPSPRPHLRVVTA
jgi:hypothetical protein